MINLLFSDIVEALVIIILAVTVIRDIVNSNKEEP